MDPEIFYPGKGAHGSSGAAAAIAICLTCPVRAECLTTAMVLRDEFGVWGGTTPNMRRKLRGVRPHGTASSEPGPGRWPAKDRIDHGRRRTA